MTFKKAKKDSLIKWRYAAKTGCDYWYIEDWLDDNYQVIFLYLSCCGFCQNYRSDDTYISHYNCGYSVVKKSCQKCPLFKVGEWCGDKLSFYRLWESAKSTEGRKIFAQAMVELIEGLEE
jgi:hypothetical protein